MPDRQGLRGQRRLPVRVRRLLFAEAAACDDDAQQKQQPFAQAKEEQARYASLKERFAGCTISRRSKRARWRRSSKAMIDRASA
ncbi:MAG: hypothetical protein KAI47_07390 [Deltaproteobacteria bacterium]|nr:hypothetical protein [Deltaproteobacteria bacterium]